MKSISKKTLLLIIGASLALILLLFVIIKSNQKEASFNRVRLSPNNTIFNQTSKSYMDTIVNVGMQELNIKDAVVTIKPITPAIVEKLKEKESTLEFKAFIIGKDKQYIIYIADMDRLSAIEVLSHELIHLQQTDLGKLIKGTKSVIWEGVEYSPEIPYEERLWEKEAYNNQYALLNDVKRILYQQN